MIFYRALQPLLANTFSILAFIAKHIPFLKEKSRKFWTTSEMRYVEGKPAFLQIDPAVFGGRKPIWIHAASGEFEYAKPVIREIAKTSGHPVLVTYFSPTFAQNVRAFPGVAASAPLPLDSRDELEQFIAHLQPSALLIARTDAWPNTVFVAELKKIPILLFSATFQADSKRLRGLGRGLTIETLQKISKIQCVSHDDQSLLKTLGLQNVDVCGDTRYDQVLERLKGANPRPSFPAQSIFDRALIAGSVWSEDLIPVLTASFNTFKESPHTLILVPHEISGPFLAQIEAAAKKFGYQPGDVIRFSQLTASAELSPGEARKEIRVIIVDRVGLLAEIYLLGQVAFVGGSFRKTVHSVMEPLAAGCLTVVGPLHTNNREALEFKMLPEPNELGLANVKYVSVVADADSFTQTLRTLWKALDKNNFSSVIRSEIAKRGGATSSVLRWLSETRA